MYAVRFPGGKRDFSPKQPPVKAEEPRNQRVMGGGGARFSGHGDDHSLPSSSNFKKQWMELQLIPPYVFMVSMRLTSYFLPFTVHLGKHILQSEMTDLTLTTAQ